MIPSLILVRHGNTFEAGQSAFWVGARSDLPLTHQGEMQSDHLASYILRCFRGVQTVVAGPLQRTRRTAEIIAKRTERTVMIDDRLREIDYGKWEGLTSKAIIDKFGATTLEQWEQYGVWPKQMCWQPDEAVLLAALNNFLQEQLKLLRESQSSSVAVTSNGLLRLIYRLVTSHAADAAAKVNTGHLCVLEASDLSGWQIRNWNLDPTSA